MDFHASEQSEGKIHFPGCYKQKLVLLFKIGSSLDIRKSRNEMLFWCIEVDETFFTSLSFLLKNTQPDRPNGRLPFYPLEKTCTSIFACHTIEIVILMKLEQIKLRFLTNINFAK